MMPTPTTMTSYSVVTAESSARSDTVGVRAVVRGVDRHNRIPGG
jgi:hypothetical protein